MRNSKTTARDISVFSAALAAACDYIERLTGMRPHTALFLDINGTIAELGGSRYPVDLAKWILYGIYQGILVIPTSDNPDAGIVRWFGKAGVPKALLPIRIGDHGSRVIVEIPGRRKFTHHLVEPHVLGGMEEVFADLRVWAWQQAIRGRLTPIAAHPTHTSQARPHNGDHGMVVFDFTRSLGTSGEVRLVQDGQLIGCAERVPEIVGNRLLHEADRRGFVLGERESEDNRFWIGPRVPVRKVCAATEVVALLPESIRTISQLGDSSNERGMEQICSPGAAFAPNGTWHARTPGVLELNRTCLEGAVPETIRRLLWRAAQPQ